MIPQFELATYLSLVEKIRKAESKLKIVKARLSDLEGSLVNRLSLEEKVEEGEFIARVEQKVGRAVISWKGVVVELKGQEFVEKKLAEAPREIEERLVVQHRNNPS